MGKKTSVFEKAQDYCGVICGDANIRIIVSSRGVFYTVQEKVRGQWVALRKFRHAETLDQWLLSRGWSSAWLFSPAYAALPSWPCDCALAPYPQGFSSAS